MQYAVPQFTDVEDKLIGPLTLKQFLFLLATGAIVLFFYSLLKLSVFFFIFATPVALLGAALSFAKFNGRPLYGYLPSFIYFVSRPQARIFKREEPNIVVHVQKIQAKLEIPSKLDEPAEGRLKKLAYLLDQKTTEEKELITRS